MTSGDQVAAPAAPRSVFPAWLQLLRLPNLFTVPGDALAGFLFAGGVPSFRLAAVVAAGLCLYGLGLVLNDLSDIETDRRERPTRPLPSGRIPRSHAVLAAVLLLVGGLGAARIAGDEPFRLSLLLMAVVVAYNQGLKKDPLGGPLALGACRAMNVMLGITLAHPGIWPAAAWIPPAAIGLYIVGVSALARREMEPGAKIGPPVIGLLIGLLLPIQAAFCALSGTGSTGWICAGVLVMLWPAHALLGKRIHAS
jgi:4-hydroxybenzoate polyprenyltransferase